MHFMPDTEDADSAAESFWPEGFKEVIRREVGEIIAAELSKGKRFRKVYEQRYSAKYPDFDRFADRIADMVVIGAERGADDAFDEVYAAFRDESQVPDPRRYARYFWPETFSDAIKRSVHQAIVDEYRREKSYKHAYDVHSPRKFSDFEEFLNAIADLVVTGTENGADDMLGEIYKSFLTFSPLPPARRHPKRLKGW